MRKIFTKMIRELVTAARLGGGDPASNPRLRTAIDKALAYNMTRDTLNRACCPWCGRVVKTATSKTSFMKGTAVMVSCLSDNRNRTVSEVRHAFTKTGSNLGTDGSVAYLFTKKGVFSYEPGLNEDQVMEVALEAGADDIMVYDDGKIEVFRAPESFETIKKTLEAAGFIATTAEISMIPSTRTELDLENAQKLLRLIDMLEDSDDVQEVYHNGAFSDAVV